MAKLKKDLAFKNDQIKFLHLIVKEIRLLQEKKSRKINVKKLQFLKTNIKT